MPSSSTTKTKRKTTNKSANSSKIKPEDNTTTLDSSLKDILSSSSASKKQKTNNTVKVVNSNLPRNRSLGTFEKDEMSKYVIWRRPIQTLYYFFLELIDITLYYLFRFLNHRKLMLFSCSIALLITAGFYVEGSHLPIFLYLRKKFLWCCYWVGLGVASSIGLGTGLHTFLLYLGPFIAQVTLAAYECNSLKFPEPPYPDSIICPNDNTNASDSSNGAYLNENEGILASTAAMVVASSISILSIMSKVRLESFMWGAGTAIGELPPYFMARASALSSIESRKLDNGIVSSSNQDEELAEFEELLEAEKTGNKNLNFFDKLRLSVFKLIRKVGFWGILLCASIPNPLFDLAGITCGHFLVKFWTFFGATLIGKAIIKMHIQKMFVIFLFSQHHLDNLFKLISKMPYFGHKLQPVFQEWLDNEKQKLHSRDKTATTSQQPSESILSWLLNKIVLFMVLFFIISIINSLAQRRYKRLVQKKNTNGLLFNSKVAND